MELDTRIAARLADRAAGPHPADQQFRLLVDSVTDYAIFLLDPTGCVVSWNPGAARIEGYTAQEILGRHFSLFYPPEERAAGTPGRLLFRAEREGRAEHEGWRVRGDGSRFWADTVITALRAASGALSGFAKVTRDMTAQQRLRENETMLEAMFEVSPMGIVLVDGAGRCLRANPAFLRMFGYGAEELAQKSFAELAHPDELEESWRALEELIQGRRNQAEHERRYLRRNGQVIWVRASAARLPDPEGRLRCIMAMVEDITERKRAHEALRESEARLQAFTSHSPAAMFLKDREGRYRLVNERFLKEFALRREQVIGATDAELFPRADAEASAASDAQAIARGEPIHFEQTSQGARVNLVSKFPVFDAAGAILGVGGVASDITERKRAEQALRRQGTLLAEAQMLAGLGCWEWDPSSGRLTWSDELYRIYGLDPATFQPTFEGYLERVHPEDREQVAGQVTGAVAEGRGFALDERIVRRDGVLRQLRSHGEVVRDEAGRPRTVVAACLDVTEHKAAEAALRALSRRLVEVEENERRRLARELHDRVGQNLAALNINLDILLGRLQDPGLRKRLEDSLALVDGTLQSIENVMADLRPPLLDEYGLGAALAWYGEEYAERTGIRVEVDGSAPEHAPAPEAAVALFRIAQEALNNVAKHAHAKMVHIDMSIDATTFTLSIRDDGCGFDPGQPRGRWGMSTMRERAEAAGGRLSIESSFGKGTVVRATMPL